MNKFEIKFFKKYIADGQKLEGIIHMHFIEIFTKIFLWLMLGAIIPSILFFYSDRIKDLISFLFLEGLLIFVFFKIIYDIFDWYNDVWIVTNSGILQLEWSLFKTTTIFVEFEKIEGLEVEQNNILDKLLSKGNLILHKFGEDTLILNNAIKPYNAVDLIEKINNESELDTNSSNNKFDVIMDALGGVVENYLDKKHIKNEEQIKIDKAIKIIEKSDGTIDLR